jgi:hypothetical protein
VEERGLVVGHETGVRTQLYSQRSLVELHPVLVLPRVTGEDTAVGKLARERVHSSDSHAHRQKAGHIVGECGQHCCEGLFLQQRRGRRLREGNALGQLRQAGACPLLVAAAVAAPIGAAPWAGGAIHV